MCRLRRQSQQSEKKRSAVGPKVIHTDLSAPREPRTIRRAPANANITAPAPPGVRPRIVRSGERRSYLLERAPRLFARDVQRLRSGEHDTHPPLAAYLRFAEQTELRERSGERTLESGERHLARI